MKDCMCPCRIHIFMHIVCLGCEAGIASVTMILWHDSALADQKRHHRGIGDYLFFAGSLLTTVRFAAVTDCGVQDMACLGRQCPLWLAALLRRWQCIFLQCVADCSWIGSHARHARPSSGAGASAASAQPHPVLCVPQHSTPLVQRVVPTPASAQPLVLCM